MKHKRLSCSLCTYDVLNRIVEVGSDNTTFVKYSYDANGNRSMLQYPASNLYVGYKYNNANLVILLENYAGADVSSYYQYSYYLDGNQSNKDTDLTNYTYDYDHMGRLIEDSCGDGNTIDYTYDRFSNRATMTVADMDEYTVEYDYDLNNRLLHEVKTNNDTSEVTTTTYTYDAQGNQLAKTSADGVETRTYNGFGQTMSATVKGVQTIYAYRPDGLRYKKMVGTATTIHIWNGANVIADITNGAISAKYLRGAGLATREAGGKREYYMFNAHGDVVRRMDTAGNAVKEYDYDAFGNENKPDAGDANVFRYCGEYFDKETGNVYLRARYYSPGIGRFGTQDPAMNGLNWYTYCGNSPVFLIDPTGEVAFTQKMGNDYTYFSPSRKITQTMVVVESIPYLGPVIGMTKAASDQMSGIELIGSSFVLSSLSAATAINDLVDAIEKLGIVKALKQSRALKYARKATTAVGRFLTTRDFHNAFSSDKQKEQDVIDQIIGKEFSKDMRSSSREMVEYKYLAANSSVRKLISEGKITYSTSFSGDVTDYEISSRDATGIRKNIKSFNGLSDKDAGDKLQQLLK